MNKIFKYTHLALVVVLSLWTEQGQASSVLEQQDRPNTASHVMLDHLYKGPINTETSQKILAVATPKLALNVTLTLEKAKLVESIIAEEKVYAGKYVVYHALSSQVWFCFRVLSNWRHMMSENHETQTTTLRSLDMFFTKYPTAKTLLAGKQSDTALHYQLAGLCCNPTLLSWLDRNDECTLDFFLRSFSMAPPKNPWSIIELFLKEAELTDTDILDTLKGIYAKEFENKSLGCLLQIFLDPEIVDDICIPSVAFGDELKNTQGQTLLSAKHVLDSLRAGHLDSDTPIEKVQIRLHADFARFNGKLRVFDHFTDGNHGRLDHLDRDIRNTFIPHLGDAVKSLLLKDYIYSSNTPILLQKARKESGIQPEQMTRAHPSILCEDSGPMEFLRQVCENPSIMEDQSQLNQVCYFVRSEQVKPIKDIPLINLILANKEIFQNPRYLDLLMPFLNKNYDAARYIETSTTLLLEGAVSFLVQGIKEGFIAENTSPEHYSCLMKVLIDASFIGEEKVKDTKARIQTFTRAIANNPLQWEEGSEKVFSVLLFWLGEEGSETMLAKIVEPGMAISQLKELFIKAHIEKTDKLKLDTTDDLFE